MTTQPRRSGRMVWAAIVVALAGMLGLAGTALLGWGRHQAQPKAAEIQQGAGERGEEAEPKGVFQTKNGEIAVHLEGATQRLIGLRTETLSPTMLRPEVAAYGVLQEDPSETFTVRAPTAGIVETPEGGRWPDLGAVLPDGAVVGAITPRVVPVERIDLVSRLATAQADVATTTAALAADKAARDRARRLNADGKIVSDRVLQEAETRVAADEARLRAAIENERLIAASLRAVAGPTGPKPLRAGRGGTVVAVFAQPGEAIEAGQPVLRLARFDTVLAKLVVPSGVALEDDAEARVTVIGHDDHPLAGKSIALVAVDPTTQGQTVLVRLRAAGFPLRPGEAVTAFLTAPGRPIGGVVIPRDAIVRYAGEAWAYAQTARETFVQRAVPTDRPVDGGWLVTRGFKPGERVVTVGAESVLSEELKAQIPSGEEGESGEQ